MGVAEAGGGDGTHPPTVSARAPPGPAHRKLLDTGRMDRGPHRDHRRRAAAGGRRARDARARDERAVPDLPRARRPRHRRVPGMPHVELDPELVLLIFLPPLLYGAAFFASLRDLRRNVGPISALSVGLVLATCVAVAVVVHAAVPGMSWAAAFVLGAIVSPTDPVAATAIAGPARRPAPRRRGRRGRVADQRRDRDHRLPRRRRGGHRRARSASGTRAAQFLLGAAGGVAIGLAVGWVVAFIRERLDDPPVEITISLLTAYARLPAGRGARASPASSPPSPSASTWARRPAASRTRRCGCRASRCGRSSPSCSTRSCSC